MPTPAERKRDPGALVRAAGLAGVGLLLALILSGAPLGIPLNGQATTEVDVVELATPDPIARHLAAPVPAPAVAEEALGELREALSQWRSAPSARAADRTDRALALLPTLGDWRPLIRAELRAPLGDTAAVRSALSELDPATGFLDRWGWRLGVQAFEEARSPAAARRFAEGAARSELGEAAAGAAWLRAGDLALAARDTAAALTAFRLVLESPAGATVRGGAARRIDRIVPNLDPDQRMVLGRALLDAGEPAPALRLLEPLLDGFRGSERDRATLRIGMGRALVELARNMDALILLAPLTGELTPPEFAAPALYWSGRARYALGDPGAAEEAFLLIARRAPGSPLAEEGILLLLEGEADRPNATGTARLSESLFTVGVSTTAGELHAIRFGTARYLTGDYRAAAASFEGYLEGSRRSATRQQAGYWAALAHERTGDRNRADARLRDVYDEDPLSFYGVFAGERLGAPVLAADLHSGPSPVPGIRTELDNALLRLRVHQVVPTSGSFAFELARLTEHFFRRGDAAYDFAEALLEGGFPVQGIVLGREIRRREGEWNLRLLRIVHPFPHRETIVREARARGLDPFFVAGLIRQESAFHTSIRSSAGAIGLMQLMPATAREVAQASGIRYSEAALSDPEINVRLGTSFLATMLNRFDGRAEDALAAYNAGPTRIRQWRQRPEYRDRDVFIESIPFRETRHYVKVVQQFTRIYTALYGCGDFEPCLGLSYTAAHARSPAAGSAPGTATAR